MKGRPGRLGQPTPGSIARETTIFFSSSFTPQVVCSWSGSPRSVSIHAQRTCLNSGHKGGIRNLASGCLRIWLLVNGNFLSIAQSSPGVKAEPYCQSCQLSVHTT